MAFRGRPKYELLHRRSLKYGNKYNANNVGASLVLARAGQWELKNAQILGTGH